jgi:hypothetical protein
MACSSDGDSSETKTSGQSNNASSDEGSVKDYCAAVEDGVALAQQAKNGEAPADIVQQFADAVARAAAAAPAEVRTFGGRAWRGDPYAQEDANFYIQENCDVDPADLPSASG